MPHALRLAQLPVAPVPFAELPYVRGHVDILAPHGDRLTVSGWLVAPGEPIDAIEIHHEGRHVATERLRSRPDVKAVYPWLPYADDSGFEFVLPLTAAQATTTTRLDLITRARGERRGRLSQLVRADVDRFPSPPDAFIYRVAHMREPHGFKVSGLKSLGDFFEPIARFGDPARARRILDWGCGCGRMAMFALAAEDCPEFAGADIDPLAVAWCNAHLRRDAFTVLDPMPPTVYPSAHFDLIYAYSVLTHLTRDVQHAWLAEIRRLLTPGGLFLTTTHGQLAYTFACASLAATFPAEAIVDATLDSTLGDIAPTDYYRSTYQSRDYTLREFGRYFTVLEYAERGATNFQDLIVMQKAG